MVQLAVSTQLFGRKILNEMYLRMMRESGFQHAELFAAPGHFDWEDAAVVARIARMLRALDLSVCSLHAPWAPGQDIAAIDPEQRQRSLQAVDRAIDALVQTGGTVLILHPGAGLGDPQHRADQLRLAEESIRQVASWCAERGARVALENPPPYELAGESEIMLSLYARLADLPVVQACFDTGHAHLSTQGVGFVRRVPKELLVVHLSDNAGQTDEHLPPGMGTIVWPAFLSALHSRDFTGTAVLELTDQVEPEAILQRGRRWMLQVWPETVGHGADVDCQAGKIPPAP